MRTVKEYLSAARAYRPSIPFIFVILSGCIGLLSGHPLRGAFTLISLTLIILGPAIITYNIYEKHLKTRSKPIKILGSLLAGLTSLIIIGFGLLLANLMVFGR